jgi:hypothetical protein
MKRSIHVTRAADNDLRASRIIRRMERDRTLHDAQLAGVRDALARAVCADAGDFDREALRITVRPEQHIWPFAAMVVDFGIGAVACVEERYERWFREHAPEDPHRAGYLLLSLARHAGGDGDEINAQPGILGWALSARPAPVAVPPYHLERVDRDWMAEWQRRDIFPNALGSAMQAHRTYRNKFAFALFDADDEPVAVAGVYDTVGLSEIGVDVRRDRRGGGLAPVVVQAAVGAILDDGGTPFYACAMTNVRSQRTALASGFLPACSFALAYHAGEGLAAPA